MINRCKLESLMSVPTSFINYMKAMRNYYKSGAQQTNPLLIDFNFDDMEIDARSYGFTHNDSEASDKSHSLMNNDSHYGISDSDSDNIASSDNESPAMEAAINSALEKQRDFDKLEHQQAEDAIPTEIIPTEIKVIRLFDQGEILLSLDSTTSVPQKPRLTIIEKITAALTKLIK